jgi:hypothetical protein
MQMGPNAERATLVAVILCATLTPSARSQTASDSTASSAPVVREVVAGEHYKAGTFHRFLLGDDYRALWTAPIRVLELDLTSVAGGLTPTRRVGGQQTHGLALKGADGRDYTFRGLDKDPSDILPQEYQGTFVDRILQDQIASSLPGGSVAVSPMLQAAGVLHVEPRLVVLPDSPALGEFREDFKNLLGTFEEYPHAADDGSGTFGAVEIINGEKMWKLLDESPATRVDSRAFLTARLVDLLVGDWDRHRGQWRWARIPGHEKWQPVPEDRDQAFVRFEGLIVNAGRIQLPQFVSFGDKYPGIDGLTWNGRDGDRRLLVDLDKATWDEVAREVQGRITDDVIAEAVARLPDEYRKLTGASIEKSLRDRRDELVTMAGRYYRFLAKDVDLHATDEAEFASVKRDDNGDVEVAFRASDSAQPYLRRVFHTDETKEVRLYMAGGADSVVARGGDGKIKVRVIGGHGVDFVDDGSGVGVRVSDADSITVLVRGDGTHLDDRPYTMPVREKAPWIPPRDWGRRNIFYPFIGGNTDLGVLFLLGWQSEGYGFRKDPYADQHTVRVAYATNAGGFGGDYRGEFRRENSRSYSGLYVRASGLDFLHFYGYGNDSKSTEDEDFYKVKQSIYRVEPSYTFPVAGPVMATVRANATYAKTKLEANQFISEQQPYGADNFLAPGVGAGLSYDTRDSKIAPMHGAHVAVDGTVFPEMWDVVSTFSEVHGEASYYLPLGRPVLALRAGGKKVWRSFPYFEAAYIGGSRNVRGYPSQRYAGDGSVYGNAELRIPLTRIYIFVPGTLGVFGLGDVGRVFVDGENSETWHSTFGGGVWASFLNTINTVSLSIADSEEGTRVYLMAGLAF